jgi:hypothetical protein
MPLISQVPAKAPINSKIKIDDMAELMLFTIVFNTACQSMPSRIAIIPAIEALSSKAIWLDPSNEPEPNK